jgi:hypothetical protein
VAVRRRDAGRWSRRHRRSHVLLDDVLFDHVQTRRGTEHVAVDSSAGRELTGGRFSACESRRTGRVTDRRWSNADGRAGAHNTGFCDTASCRAWCHNFTDDNTGATSISREVEAGHREAQAGRDTRAGTGAKTHGGTSAANIVDANRATGRGY